MGTKFLPRLVRNLDDNGFHFKTWFRNNILPLPNDIPPRVYLTPVTELPRRGKFQKSWTIRGVTQFRITDIYRSQQGWVGKVH